jgi:tRNA A-37 threonylcarbamoyl transferase component Bud32
MTRTPVYQTLSCNLGVSIKRKMNTERATANKKTRIIKSREHTKEERREQQKRRRKRKRDNKRSELLRNISACVKDKEAEKKEPADPSPSQAQTTKICRNPTEQSRGAVMVRLAKKIEVPYKDCISSVSMSKLPSTGPGKPHVAAKVDRLKEINPDFLEYCSISPIGSGSYGDCYSAKYRGIDVVVKRAKTRNKKEDNKRVIREVLHEGKVINALGDFEGLPLLFGVITAKAPICLVLQFHGVNMRSLTLYHAAEKELIVSQNACIAIFDKICSTLQYVHSKGFLHNDIKSNNVILEERNDSSGYFPILIDFGKSKTIQVASNSEKLLVPRCQKSYLAPEVIECGRESTASDVFSLGQMLRNVSKQLALNDIFRQVVQEACKECAAQRITLKEFSSAIANLM